MRRVPDHHIHPDAVSLIRKARDETSPKHRVPLDRVLAVARYLLEWSTREGGRHADESVSQIAHNTCLAAGTVRDALAILERSGTVVTTVHGGGAGRGRRGSRRRLFLDGTARAKPAQSEVGTARDEPATARDEPRTARAQARDSDEHLTYIRPRARAGRDHDPFVDDRDVIDHPVPMAETIAAIRSRLGNNGSPWMDQLVARAGPFEDVAQLHPAPPADPWDGYYAPVKANET